MKQLTCEMCGSTELVKQDGFFVCQTCGCKYSVEEARKMMIEGTVDVQGTVKVDNSAFVEKYLANARRAKQKEDWEETEKYYNMVEQNDPTNIEAIFYSSYGKTKQSLVDSDIYKRQAVFNVLKKCISILDDNYDTNKDYDDQLNVIQNISDDLISLFGSSYVYNTKKNQYGMVTWSDKNETVSLFTDVCLAYCETLTNIAEKYPKDEKCVPYYKLALYMSEYALSNLQVKKNVMINIITSYHEKIHEVDPSHEFKTAEQLKEESKPVFLQDNFANGISEWFTNIGNNGKLKKFMSVLSIIAGFLPVYGILINGLELWMLSVKKDSKWYRLLINPRNLEYVDPQNLYDKKYAKIGIIINIVLTAIILIGIAFA